MSPFSARARMRLVILKRKRYMAPWAGLNFCCVLGRTPLADANVSIPTDPAVSLQDPTLAAGPALASGYSRSFNRGFGHF